MEWCQYNAKQESVTGYSVFIMNQFTSNHLYLINFCKVQNKLRNQSNKAYNNIKCWDEILYLNVDVRSGFTKCCKAKHFPWHHYHLVKELPINLAQRLAGIWYTCRVNINLPLKAMNVCPVLITSICSPNVWFICKISKRLIWCNEVFSLQ